MQVSTWSFHFLKEGAEEKGNERPFRFAGQRSQPARFHRQGRASRFQGKIILAMPPVFFLKALPVEAARMTAPEAGNGIPIRHEDHESERNNQKDSRQPMGKDCRIGRHGLHRVQLALLARHIPRMGRRCHRMLQRTVQVPLPDSLFPRGARHHLMYPGFSGLLKSDKVEHRRFYSCSYKGAVRSRAALFISATIQKTGRTGMKDTDIDTPMNYRAKLADASFRTARSSRKRFRKKSSSLRSGIFPENPAFPEASAVGPL